MTLRCLAYTAWDKFKFSPLATRLFYRGVPVKLLRPSVTVTGTVIRTAHAATDGDVTFDIQLADGSTRHCEVTPCASPAVRRIAQGLPRHATVRVTGDERYDPPHAGDGDQFPAAGLMEIHPVTAIEVVRWASKTE